MKKYSWRNPTLPWSVTAVPLGRWGLTSVFGKGTGVSPTLKHQEKMCQAIVPWRDKHRGLFLLLRCMTHRRGEMVLASGIGARTRVWPLTAPR